MTEPKVLSTGYVMIAGRDVPARVMEGTDGFPHVQACVPESSGWGFVTQTVADTYKPAPESWFTLMSEGRLLGTVTMEQARQMVALMREGGAPTLADEFARMFGFEITETEHEVIVTYTVDDDGVWLTCPCGWEHNAGHRPAPETLALLADEHRNGA